MKHGICCGPETAGARMKKKQPIMMSPCPRIHVPGFRECVKMSCKTLWAVGIVLVMLAAAGMAGPAGSEKGPAKGPTKKPGATTKPAFGEMGISGFHQVLKGGLPPVKRKHRALRYTSKLTQAFYVHVPAVARTETLGIFAFISNRDVQNLPPGYAKMLKVNELIFISPAGCGNKRLISRRGGLTVLGVLKLMQTYRIDPKRVYISGYSGGGRAGTMTAFYHSELFTGAMPMCGAMFPKRLADKKVSAYSYFPLGERDFQAARKRVRFALITGRKDYRYPFVKGLYEQGFKKYGFNALFCDIPGMNHFIATPAAVQRALNWVEGKTPAKKTGG